MTKKQFLVIGLGRFGTSIAKTIYSLGHDVLVIDKDEEKIQDIADFVTHAMVMDATDEATLKNVGIRNFDVAIVTIGTNIQASVMVTLLMKELGINYIVAKGNSEMHAKVLTKIGADKVILPEKDMAVRVAHNLVSSNIIDYIQLSKDYSILEIEAIKEWHNKSLKELDIRKKYGINVVAIKRNDGVNVSPAAEEVIKEDDIVVALGSSKEMRRIESAIAKLG